ncbi:hypothetical protein [Pseudomonas retamae]|uniref:Uncharacterized protein n=1 Tax=Pseudomonas retamae TaxID=702110 RepID=A0ABW7D6D7_9PSED
MTTSHSCYVAKEAGRRVSPCIATIALLLNGVPADRLPSPEKRGFADEWWQSVKRLKHLDDCLRGKIGF